MREFISDIQYIPESNTKFWHEINSDHLKMSGIILNFWYLKYFPMQKKSFSHR
jgi:hypothetical protein